MSDVALEHPDGWWQDSDPASAYEKYARMHSSVTNRAKAAITERLLARYDWTGRRVLEYGCGHGRIALPFTRAAREEWLAHLRSSPGDFIFTIVNSVDDLPEDPQVQANGYVTDFEHPQFGATKVMGMPVRLSETPGSVRFPAPELGQHTEEILLDVLGYDWDRITELRKREAI